MSRIRRGLTGKKVGLGRKFKKEGELEKIAMRKYGNPHYFSLLEWQRHQVLKSAKYSGDTDMQIQGKLQAIATLDKNRNPATAAKAKADRQWVASTLFAK